MTEQVNQIDRNVVRNLTRAYVEAKIHERRRKGLGSFILPDLVGSVWPPELGLFYDLYGKEKVAAAELGKILVKVARDVGLVSKTEDRRGKKDAITRHYFPEMAEGHNAGTQSDQASAG